MSMNVPCNPAKYFISFYIDKSRNIPFDNMNGQHDVEVEEHHHPCSPLHNGEGEIPVGRKVGKTPPLVLPVWETQILIWYRDQHNTVPTTVSWWGQQTYPPAPLVSTSCPK